MPVKPRCHTKDSNLKDTGGANQPMTCSHGPGAADDLKIGTVMTHKSELAACAVDERAVAVPSSESGQKEITGSGEQGSNAQ